MVMESGGRPWRVNKGGLAADSVQNSTAILSLAKARRPLGSASTQTAPLKGPIESRSTLDWLVLRQKVKSERWDPPDSKCDSDFSV